MNNNVFFFSQLNKTSVCKYYCWEQQLTLLRAVPTLKATKITQEAGEVTTDQRPLPFPVRMIQKTRALLLSQLHCGSRGMKLPLLFVLWHQWHTEMFGTDHACCPQPLWQRGRDCGNITMFCLLPLGASRLPGVVRCPESAFLKSSNDNCGLLPKQLATSPQWTACNQLTVNTPFHSLRRERALPYFVRGRKSKDETFKARHNFGHNIRASSSLATDVLYSGTCTVICTMTHPPFKSWISFATGSTET